MWLWWGFECEILRGHQVSGLLSGIYMESLYTVTGLLLLSLACSSIMALLKSQDKNADTIALRYSLFENLVLLLR